MGFILQILGGGTPAKPKPKPLINPPYTARQENLKWKALAPLVKKHFDTGDKTVQEIAADLSLAAYKKSLKNKDRK